MRKSALFISAVLSTFALVILYGVVSAYRSDQVTATVPAVVEVAAQPTDVALPVPTDVPTTTPSLITPQEAAQIAAKVIGSDNLLSAEASNFNGVDAYLVTFTNNDMVYVGLDGQVLSVQIAPVVINVSAPAVKHNSNNNNSSSSSSHNESEHESHDD